MTKFKIFFILILIANSFWSCEKDDICESTTATTPRLIVEFYDDLNPTVKKNVTNLVVSSSDVIEVLSFSGVSKIEIPLKTTENITKFAFRLTSDTTIPVLLNEDLVELNYNRKDIFISRACGYKTIFTLNTTNGFNQISDADNWLKTITIVQPNILNENEVHVKIFI